MLGPWLNKTMNQLVCSLSVYGLFLSTVSGIEVLVSLRLNSQNPFSVHFHVWVSSSNVNPARVRHSLQPNFTEKRHREQPSTMPGGMMTALALAFGAPLATGPGGFGAAAAALGGTPLLLAFDLETAFSRPLQSSLTGRRPLQFSLGF